MESIDPEIARTQEEEKKMDQQIPFITTVNHDPDLYGGADKSEDNVSSIPVSDAEENTDALDSGLGRRPPSFTSPASSLKEMPGGGAEVDDDIVFKKPQSIIDALAAADKTPNLLERRYGDVMREKDETLRPIAKRKKEEEELKEKETGGSAKKAKAGSDFDSPESIPATPAAVADARKTRSRWDETPATMDEKDIEERNNRPLASVIAAMRPDTTARAFSVVASALGIPELLPSLKAVCRSNKSSSSPVPHIGIKIVQQIAVLLGSAVLPHLKSLVEIVEHGLTDEENEEVITITALSLAALAKAAAPYGIESFESVLEPLWNGIRSHRGKVLVAFLKAIGFIIPLMDATNASHYTKEAAFILIRESQSPNEGMKKTVLKVLKQCVRTEGVEADYIRNDILPDFFRNFWVRRTALDGRNYRRLVDTTVEIANKVGVADIVGRVVEDLLDKSEPYRRMVMETIGKVVANLGVSDIDAGLEGLLVHGIIGAFQVQTRDDDNVMLNGYGAVVNALGRRVRPYLSHICSSSIEWRLSDHQSPKVRQQAANLISRIVAVMKDCHEEQLIGHLGVVLYSNWCEECPETLGSILGALKAIVNVVDLAEMTPPIEELLPGFNAILKYRSDEKVRVMCMELIGRIADRGAEFFQASGWMRICFVLFEMLKVHETGGIGRAAVDTLGCIAKAIGPQDVLATLLNNLAAEERQNCDCTTLAIATLARMLQSSPPS